MDMEGLYTESINSYIRTLVSKHSTQLTSHVDWKVCYGGKDRYRPIGYEVSSCENLGVGGELELWSSAVGLYRKYSTPPLAIDVIELSGYVTLLVPGPINLSDNWNGY